MSATLVVIVGALTGIGTYLATSRVLSRIVLGFAVLGHGATLLLLAAGPITVAPLIWFTMGARRLRLATIGVLQYLAPTGHFFLAVAVYDEARTWYETNQSTLATQQATIARKLETIRAIQKAIRLGPFNADHASALATAAGIPSTGGADLDLTTLPRQPGGSSKVS